MKISGQHLIFFSATNSTRTLVTNVGKETGVVTLGEHNITNRREDQAKTLELQSSEMLIVGVPSYSGRVPSVAIASLEKFKGNNSPAIILCTYGNRDYEDTLLELRDVVTQNGFRVIAAGAFVARHSIFPEVAASRPTETDKSEAKAFVNYAMKLIDNVKDINTVPEIKVRGNFPYRKTSNIPLRPTGNRRCDKCGTCVHLCPTGAIPVDSPRKTDKKKCISCARCIAVCPQKARAFRGLIYKVASNSFAKKCAEPQPNVTSYIS